MVAAVPLLTAGERAEARRLVESQGLSFEAGCDDVVGIYEADRLVATAARAGYVLKMFAIGESCQGGEVLGHLVSALTGLARAAGHDGVFVYTRPEAARSFEHCGFRLLVATGEVTLLEWGGGLERYLRAHCPDPDTRHRSPAGRRPAPSGSPFGAIVLNGNPFTRGHQYLVETAARQVDRLFVFVVREDRSVFPFSTRFAMAADGTRHVPNVVLLDTDRYAVSAGTFPSYFLREQGAAARLQMQVDARLFGAHLAPAFGITRRFVGHEPYCPTTAAYNRAMAEVLPEYGVTLVEIERAADPAGGFVSATRVRAALEAGDMESVARLVPATTLAHLPAVRS